MTCAVGECTESDLRQGAPRARREWEAAESWCGNPSEREPLGQDPQGRPVAPQEGLEAEFPEQRAQRTQRPRRKDLNVRHSKRKAGMRR